MLDHQVRHTASQLATLLHHPGVAEMIAAAPCVARTLRTQRRCMAARPSAQDLGMIYALM